MLKFCSLILLISFVSSSDLAANPISFGIVGDAGMKLSSADRILQALREEGLNKVILTGDQLYQTTVTYDSVWGDWSDMDFSVVAHGNHYKTYELEQNYFGMPGEYYTKSFGPEILFIVLNSNNENTIEEQMVWYRNVLENSTEKFVFVVLHHPPYTISNYHSWDEKRDFHLQFRPLTLAYSNKISAIFTGHDHFSSLYRINDLTWVHNGASLQHKSTYNVDDEVEPGVWLKTAWYYDETFHFSRLDVDVEAGTAVVNYIRASDRKRTCTVNLRPFYSLEQNCL